MAVNPMQRKAHNSFLLGMLVTLLITGIIIAVLILQVAKLKKEKEETTLSTQYAYVITSEIKSGTEIPTSAVKGIELKSGIAASVAYSAQTKDAAGNPIADTEGNLFPLGMKAKVDLHPGTIVTSDLTYEDEPLDKDIRTQEYNVVRLFSQLETGDYVDIRLRLASGQDYIVVSHKMVTIPAKGDGTSSSNCIWVDLNEQETLTMSSAIIDTYKAEGAMLYAAKYIEPGMQEAAQVTYLPSAGVVAQLQVNPNILEEAKKALVERYRDKNDMTVNRNPIDNAIDNENAEDNVSSGVEQEIQGIQEEREEYLESFGM